MGCFKELNKNMNDVMTKLVGNPNLCKLLKYNTSNALSQTDVDSPENLLYDKIFPYPFNTDVLTEASSLIITTFDNFTPTKGQGFKNSYVVFRVIVHNSLWVTNDGLRPYLILNELDEIFNNQRVIGLGKLAFNSCNGLWISQNYTGYTLVYKVTDFN